MRWQAFRMREDALGSQQTGVERRHSGTIVLLIVCRHQQRLLDGCHAATTLLETKLAKDGSLTAKRFVPVSIP